MACAPWAPSRAGWRRGSTPLVVGITGSIAKTSTKEAVAAVLGRRFTDPPQRGQPEQRDRPAADAPRLGPEHEAAVLEMGMYVGGEIADLAAMARPQIGVVTAVQPVHLSRIGTLDAIERAKAELVEALPADGTAVLNADDERVVRMAARTRGPDRSPTASTTAPTWARPRSPRAGAAGMRFTLRTPAGAPRRRARRPSGATASTTRWPRRRWGWRRAAPRRDRAPASRQAGRRPTATGSSGPAT